VCDMEKKVYLITNRSLQSQLLLNFLTQESDASVIFLDINQSFTPDAITQSIVLYDVQASSRRASKRWSGLFNRSEGHFRGYLINCPTSLSVYEKISWPFFESMISRDCPTESLLNLISKAEKSLPGMNKRYLSKKSQNIPTGSPRIKDLTEREYEILSELCKGGSNLQIANNFFISEHTVRTHIYNIFKKISVTNRTQAANWANHQFTKCLSE